MTGLAFAPEVSPVERVEMDLRFEFAGIVELEVVTETVGRARAQLIREVPAESLPEFLHRLAGERLRSLAAASLSVERRA